MSSPSGIAANGPLAVRNIKASVMAAETCPRPRPMPEELEIGMGVMASQDAKEGPEGVPGEARPELHRRVIRWQ